MERPTKGGKPSHPRYTNSAQARGNSQSTRMPPLNKYMNGPQQSFSYDMFQHQNQIRYNTMVAGAGRFPYPYPYYCASHVYTNQPTVMSSANVLHQPMPFQSTGIPLHSSAGGECLSQWPIHSGGGVPPSTQQHPGGGSPLNPAANLHYAQQSVVVPSPGSTIKESTRRSNSAIPIVDPITMLPVQLGKEEGTSNKPAGAAPPPLIEEVPKKVILSAPPPPTPSLESSSSIVITAPPPSVHPPQPTPPPSSAAHSSVPVPNNNNLDKSPPVPAVPEVPSPQPLQQPPAHNQEERAPSADGDSKNNIHVIKSTSSPLEEEQKQSSLKQDEPPPREEGVMMKNEGSKDITLLDCGKVDSDKSREEPSSSGPLEVSPPSKVEDSSIEASSKVSDVTKEEASLTSKKDEDEKAPVHEEAKKELHIEPRAPAEEQRVEEKETPKEDEDSELHQKKAVIQPEEDIKKKETMKPVSSMEEKSISKEEAPASEEEEKPSEVHAAKVETPSSTTAASEEDEDVPEGEESGLEDEEDSTSLVPEEEDEEEEGFTLKYDYKPDQWSPLNPGGKRQYDSAFLKQLQSSPLSLSKPESLPDLEIIRDLPIEVRMSAGGSNDSPDFMPNFSNLGSIVKSNSRNSLSKRPSRDRRAPNQSNPNGGGIGGGYMSSGARSLSGALPEKVELRTAENPWRPSKNKPIEAVRGLVPEGSTDSMEEQRKKVMAILNKLTPQKFDDLLESFNALKIDSEAKLSQAIDLIFEKAIDEPNYSVAYARMCEVLQTKTVADTKFRTIILNKCQHEFEKAYMSPEEKEKYEQDLEAAQTEAEKKAIKEDFEMRELRARRRSLGNVRFIGEIYKRNLLSTQIMHGCIIKLLHSRDEESLESLCRLLTTVGKQIESDTAQNLKSVKIDSRVRPLDKHFSYIQDIIDNRSPKGGGGKPPMVISNRIRFMLQDIIELRKRDWVPRRDVQGPKTLDQIHQDVIREKKAQALNQSMSRHDSRSGGGSGGSRSSSMMGGGGNRENSKRSFRSNNFSSNGGHGHHGGHSYEDGGGWGSVGGGSKKQQEGLDMEIVRNINNRNTNFDSMKFVPGTSRTSWGKGASSSGSRGSIKASEQPIIRNSNRFSSFSNYSDCNDNSGSSNISKSTSLNRNGGRSNMDRGGDFSSRSDGARSGMSRSMRSGGATEVSSSKGFSSRAYKFKGPLNLSKDLVEEEAEEIFRAYVRNNNMEEAMSDIKMRMNANCMKDFVEALIDKEVESSTSRREFLNIFIDRLMKEELLTASDCKEVISSFYSMSSDYLSDMPKFWEYFSMVIACLFVPSNGRSGKEGHLPLSVILDYLPTDHPSSSSKQSLAFVSVFLKQLSSFIGKESMSELFHSSLASSQSQGGGKHSITSPAVESLLSENESTLGYLRNPPPSSSATSSFPSSSSAASEETRKMEALFASKATNEEICDWIHSSVDKARASENGFIRSLVTECVRSAIKKPQIELNNEDFKYRISILEMVLGSDSDKQLQALFAIQKLVHELTYPPGLLNSVIYNLSDQEVISDNVFWSWKHDDSPAERDGKGICMSTLMRFFEAIDK